MSIRDLIKGHVAAQRLFVLAPLIEGLEVKRHMIVSHDVYVAVTRPYSWGKKEEFRLGKLRGDLDRFITGRKISLALFPKGKPVSTYMARLEPVTSEVWDLRSCDPRPGIRVVGRFSERDTFIALCWDFHENLHGKSWDPFQDRCGNEWKRLFPGVAPFSGKTVREYISEDANPV
jgi:hypothetical protein